MPRRRGDEEWIDRLVDRLKAGGEIYPVILAEYKERFYLLDGRLRIEACRRIGIKKIPAIIIPVESEEELRRLIYLHRHK